MTALTDEYAVPIDEIDVSDPALYQQDCWYGLFKRPRREVMGGPQRLYSNFIRGITALPVRIRAA